jgi:hypothetical protein
MNKKITILFAFLFLVLAVNFITAETSYCCEKTVNGAWCQNAPVDQCADNFRKAATSCEATSYCKLGTCVDVGEGICQENTPQRVCENNDGVWYDQPSDELSQCQLGCCTLGGQAAYVTQTRCKSLSSLYGLETIFRNDLNEEILCIASATSDEKGACVIDRGGERTCKMITQKECQTMGSISTDSNGGGFIENLFGEEEETTDGTDVSFHEGYLCSADVLATDCGPRGGTTCVEGKDQVYYLDTCGNLANIYDYAKRNDQDYWTYLKGVEESCGYGQSNANSRDCGNCDYYSGSTCKSFRQTESPAARYGDYVCSDLSCEYKDETYDHGEVWCDYNTRNGLELNLPGSEDFRLLCYNGEVTVEPCDPWRASICMESEIEGFSYAVCRANEWQNCVPQETEEDCLNSDQRDCVWETGYSVLRDEQGYELVVNEDGELVEANKDKDGVPEDGREKATCVPRFAPGFNFWETENAAEEKGRTSEADDICEIGTYYCNVKYEYGIFRDKDKIETDDEKKKMLCEENCYCIPGYVKGDSNKCKEESCGDYDHAKFVKGVQNICGSMGDCGVSVNYMGYDGYYDEYEIDFSQIE